jgi:hypothetical protein
MARDVSLIEDILEDTAVEEENHLLHRTSMTALQECSASVHALPPLVVDLEPVLRHQNGTYANGIAWRYSFARKKLKEFRLLFPRRRFVFLYLCKVVR